MRKPARHPDPNLKKAARYTVSAAFPKMQNKQTPSKQASKNYNLLSAGAHTFRAAHPPFSAPQTRLFFRQGFSPPPFPVFLSPTRACAPLPHRAALLRPDGIGLPSGSLL
ncbi:hypothetical protein [Neisseria lactamica]|uniref:hypothetical protein n=1 Tax=Neisseria lactamica TaxID=486 RepID=UPI001864E728|nr:hypothetical protein [Neisseria lactamica]